jgi:hypothetical protein
MSVNELRQAAETLRGLAQSVDDCQSWSFSPGTREMVGDPASNALLSFIHTMSPTLALVLADWLDQCAERLARGHHAGSRHSHRIARLINGAES